MIWKCPITYCADGAPGTQILELSLLHLKPQFSTTWKLKWRSEQMKSVQSIKGKKQNRLKPQPYWKIFLSSRFPSCPNSLGSSFTVFNCYFCWDAEKVVFHEKDDQWGTNLHPKIPTYNYNTQRQRFKYELFLCASNARWIFFMTALEENKTPIFKP